MSSVPVFFMGKPKKVHWKALAAIIFIACAADKTRKSPDADGSVHTLPESSPTPGDWTSSSFVIAFVRNLCVRSLPLEAINLTQ